MTTRRRVLAGIAGILTVRSAPALLIGARSDMLPAVPGWYLENVNGLIFYTPDFYQGKAHKYRYIVEMWGSPNGWGTGSTYAYNPAFWGFYSPSSTSGGHTRFYIERSDARIMVQFGSGSIWPEYQLTDERLQGLFQHPASKHVVQLDYDGTAPSSSYSYAWSIDGVQLVTSRNTTDFTTLPRGGCIMGTCEHSNASASASPTKFTPPSVGTRLYRHAKWLDGELVQDYVPYQDGTGIGLLNNVDGTVLRPYQGLGVIKHD